MKGSCGCVHRVQCNACMASTADMQAEQAALDVAALDMASSMTRNLPSQRISTNSSLPSLVWAARVGRVVSACMPAWCMRAAQVACMCARRRAWVVPAMLLVCAACGAAMRAEWSSPPPPPWWPMLQYGRGLRGQHRRGAGAARA